jgi:hypothetical protein
MQLQIYKEMLGVDNSVIKAHGQPPNKFMVEQINSLSKDFMIGFPGVKGCTGLIVFRPLASG